MIPKVQLQRCFISVSLGDIKILGYPMRIDHKSYVRNAFYFNLCFVFQPGTRTIGYEPIIRKVTEYLLSLELSSKFLSQTDETKLKRLELMLHQIRSEINKNQHCMIHDGSNVLPLSVVPHYEDNEWEISDNGEFAHKAPVLLETIFSRKWENWDLTTMRVK